MRVVMMLLVAALSLGPLLARADGSDDTPPLELGRDTLPVNDGWAAFSTGTTGGSVAAPEHVFTVTNRQELVAALAVGPVPKITAPSTTARIPTANCRSTSAACSRCTTARSTSPMRRTWRP